MEEPPTSTAPTVRQGCLLTAGGVLLAFFGCFGLVASTSTVGEMVGLVLVVPGAIVMIMGLFKIVAVIWQAMSKPLDR